MTRKRLDYVYSIVFNIRVPLNNAVPDNNLKWNHFGDVPHRTPPPLPSPLLPPIYLSEVRYFGMALKTRCNGSRRWWRGISSKLVDLDRKAPPTRLLVAGKTHRMNAPLMHLLYCWNALFIEQWYSLVTTPRQEHAQ